MAPDIDSLPPSPYRTQISSDARRPIEPRRHSERGAVPSPGNSFSSHAVIVTPPPRSPLLPSSTISGQPILREDNTGVDPGPGPLRHPRPLTAADLHMQLEKEQEAVVNRLTRELTLLRQQTASVASTTSSTSTGVVEQSDPQAQSTLVGATHPIPSRRHRSSSNLSSRSTTIHSVAANQPTNQTSVASTLHTAGPGMVGTMSTGIAPPREGHMPSHSYSRDPLSRQSSVASRRSDASSPSLSSSIIGGQADHHAPGYVSRHSTSMSQASVGYPPASTPPTHHTQHRSSVSRYDELVHTRAELDMIKQENEALKQRIRELERSTQRSHD